ncbi:MAG: HNH endonuclease [Verrucomicrobia bacterium]|nr:HNH endonuclease [Verrucomicrobiota bacterium]
MRLIKLYTGIDYRFRPESYWAAARNPLEAALRNVKGRNRREMIKDYYEAGNLDQLGESLLGDTLDEQSRKNLKLIHPTFMGGEYLPDYARSEVEIARIELESTTNDVISLRARSSGLRIKYRLVDEYASEFRPLNRPRAGPFLGHNFAECHHVLPISEVGESRQTKVRDLAVVCSNCHRMLHRRRPWLTVSELRNLIKSHRQASVLS